MQKILKMRCKKRGFTLVELLIVIMIIAILAGMMMLATGSATDSATATKIINDLRAYKSAATIILLDSGVASFEELLQDPDSFALFLNSVDVGMDRPLFNGSEATYGICLPENGKQMQVDDGSGGKVNRVLLGFSEGSWAGAAKFLTEGGVGAKLEARAHDVGLYNQSGEFFKAGDDTICMIFQ